MRDDRFNNNFIELMAGTNNRLQPAYMEAVNAVDKSETKLVDYVHRFVESISKVRKKDSKITASAGNIKKYAGYDSITTMIDYLKKEMKSDSRLKDVITVMNALETNQPLYTDAYENKMDLIIMEYEVCVDMVSNTLTLMVADSIKITDTNDKLEVKCDPKSKSPSSIYKVMSELAKEVSNPKHKNYLENMLKVNDAVKKNKVHTESYMVEASHGKLKFDHRLAVGVSPEEIKGHDIHVIYSLDNMKLVRNYNTGDFYSLFDVRNNTSDEEVAKMKQAGNTDHQSYGQKVLTIIDLTTGKRLKEAYVKDALTGFDSSNFIRVGEVEEKPSFKSTAWPKNNSNVYGGLKSLKSSKYIRGMDANRTEDMTAQASSQKYFIRLIKKLNADNQSYEDAIHQLKSANGNYGRYNNDIDEYRDKIEKNKKLIKKYEEELHKLDKDLNTWRPNGNKDRLNESIELYDLYDLYSENVVADTIEAIDMVIGGVINIGFLSADILRMLKKSLFGIIPLIRTCLYIKYKKRADTIEVLEQQAALITQNIERLKNRKNIDPKEKARIIKEQQAIVKAYQKKAANLRAEFAEAEKVASREMNYENKIMSNSTSTKSSNTTANNRDDDFILENGQSIINIFDK